MSKKIYIVHKKIFLNLRKRNRQVSNPHAWNTNGHWIIWLALVCKYEMMWIWKCRHFFYDMLLMLMVCNIRKMSIIQRMISKTLSIMIFAFGRGCWCEALKNRYLIIMFSSSLEKGFNWLAIGIKGMWL